jgi:hypothetical protein
MPQVRLSVCFVCLSVCLSFCQPVCCLSVCLSFCLSRSMPMTGLVTGTAPFFPQLRLCLSVCLSVCMSVCPVYHPVCLSSFVSACLSVSQSVSQSASQQVSQSVSVCLSTPTTGIYAGATKPTGQGALLVLDATGGSVCLFFCFSVFLPDWPHPLPDSSEVLQSKLEPRHPSHSQKPQEHLSVCLSVCLSMPTTRLLEAPPSRPEQWCHSHSLGHRSVFVCLSVCLSCMSIYLSVSEL